MAYKFYDPDGKQYKGSLAEIVQQIDKDRDRKIVKQEFTKNKKYYISTAWLLGIDLGDPFSKKPVIYETMVFTVDGRRLDRRQYHTRKEAEDGHAEIFKEYEMK